MFVLNIKSLEGILPREVNRLAGSDMATKMSSLQDAWLSVGDDGRVEAFGLMADLDPSALAGDRKSVV